MGIWDTFKKNLVAMTDVGSSSLSDAAIPDKTENKPGVYILFLNGKIKKVGSAEDGIQKRMLQYFNLNESGGLNKYINMSNRDKIKVKWQYCERKQCEELESKLFDKYKIENMEWAERRPHSTEHTVSLKI